jgi:hypothetical protein
LPTDASRRGRTLSILSHLPKALTGYLQANQPTSRMVSLAHMSHDRDDFNMNYAQPSHFTSPPMDPALEMDLPPESYGAYPPREAYPTTMAYDGTAIYAAEAPYMYPEDSDMRVPSSNLSTASASSSNMGSPLSNHCQLAPMTNEWATPHGLGVSPGIVDQSEYFSGHDYSFGHGIEGYNAQFEFVPAKGPGYVGEFSQIPRSTQFSSRQGQNRKSGSISSVMTSRASSSRTTVAAGSGGALTLALDTQLAQASVSPSPISSSAAPSRRASLVLASPATSTSSFSSPPLPAWSNNDMSPITTRNQSQSSRLVSPFFSQSSGHFVAPLGASCWFPLSKPDLRQGTGFTNMVTSRPDPSLIHPEHINRSLAMPFEHHPFPHQNPPYPGSPGLSVSPSPRLRNGSVSPFMHSNNYPQFSPYPAPVDAQRRPSLVSYHSNYSGEQTLSGDESKEKQRCPHPECGRTFKDLKAHMLTHQMERPEKCPIQTCEYHVKGFARKYDKNRHTLTHYKGTMVCGFCPGSGSAAEKSFNRADVFKRHLTAVHGVEQTPPNARKKTAGGAAKKLTGYAPDATGKCSTCSATFSNAQDFYEHLDDCVLRIVQQEDPAEAINAQRLAEVENDRNVHNTLEKNNLPTTTMVTTTDEDDEDMLADEEDEEFKVKTSASPTKKSKGNPANGVQKSKGLTHSRGGVPLPTGKTRGRKNRRDYPSSWGFDKGQMTMKKRVMAVFDGPRRLAKDDMMLSTDHEVRVPLQDGKSYVTDLDIQSLKRAHGFHGATDEEKGPWVSDDPTEDELKKMLECSPEISVQQ